MLARLAAQMAVVTNMLEKRTPSLARASMFGVWMIGLPAQAIMSQRWSSVRMKTMFGFTSVSAARPGFPVRTTQESTRDNSRDTGFVVNLMSRILQAH